MVIKKIKLVKKWWFWVILVLIAFVFASDEEFQNPIVVLDDVDSSPIVGEAGVARVTEPGWSVPVKLGFNDIGWEDSSYITRDGRYVLIFYHPTTSQFDEQAKKDTGVDDGRIYFSRRPFIKKELHPVSSPGLPSDGGPYISESGDFYYMNVGFFKPLRVARNGKRLKLGTGTDEGNPHYCDAEDELYFDGNDRDIHVFKNGISTFLPEPINLPDNHDLQPFLTDDCQTMYFTSARGATTERIFPFQVYKSQRLGEFEWSKPALFLAYPGLGGVGEFSMTRDGRQAVFTQMTQESDGVFRNNIYYVERLRN